MWGERKKSGKAGKDDSAFDTLYSLDPRDCGRNLNVVVFNSLILICCFVEYVVYITIKFALLRSSKEL